MARSTTVCEETRKERQNTSPPHPLQTPAKVLSCLESPGRTQGRHRVGAHGRPAWDGTWTGLCVPVLLTEGSTAGYPAGLSLYWPLRPSNKRHQGVTQPESMWTFPQDLGRWLHHGQHLKGVAWFTGTGTWHRLTWFRDGLWLSSLITPTPD